MGGGGSESDVLLVFVSNRYKLRFMQSNGLRPPWCKCMLHNFDRTGSNDRLAKFRAHYKYTTIRLLSINDCIQFLHNTTI